MLKGFIDLIVEHEGRFYIVDYKSNWLGPDASAYTTEAMDASVRHSRYDLQYAIYTLALHRQLRARLPGYDYENHVGGVLYLYLRGVDADGHGVHRERLPHDPGRGAGPAVRRGRSRMKHAALHELLEQASRAAATARAGRRAGPLPRRARPRAPNRSYCGWPRCSAVSWPTATCASTSTPCPRWPTSRTGRRPGERLLLTLIDDPGVSADSPLVAGNDAGTPAEAPLVLDGTRLYLRRYWNHERMVASAIRAAPRPDAGRARPRCGPNWRACSRTAARPTAELAEDRLRPRRPLAPSP